MVCVDTESLTSMVTLLDQVWDPVPRYQRDPYGLEVCDRDEGVTQSGIRLETSTISRYMCIQSLRSRRRRGFRECRECGNSYSVVTVTTGPGISTPGSVRG